MVIGPFVQRAEADPWNSDSLDSVGGDEAKYDFERLGECAANLAKNSRSSSHPGAHAFVVKDSKILDFQYLFGRPYLPSAPPGVAYVACSIIAHESRAVYFLFGSADAEKAWLNGTLLPTYPSKHGLNTYQDAVVGALRPGKNLLFVKVIRLSNPMWGITVRLEPTIASAVGIALRSQDSLNGMLLKRVVVQRNQAIVLEPRGVPPGARFWATVANHQGKVVAAMILGGTRDRWKAGKQIPDGLYRLTIHAGMKAYGEDFIIGPVAELAERLLNKAHSLRMTKRGAIDVDALGRRLAILLKASQQDGGRDQRELEKKFVYTLGELDQIIDRLKESREAFADLPGLHIRGLQSRIDDSIQYYRLFIPATYRRSSPGLPLVIMNPTDMSASRPFIESVFIAEQAEAEHLSAVAERYGLGILWWGYRAQPTGAALEFTHYDEVLREVERDYAIDPHRIYLLGACSGCAISIMVAVRWPHRFAAVGMLNPAFTLSRSPSVNDMDSFGLFSDFQAWLNHNDEVPAYLRLRALPTYVVNEGAEPGHGDLNKSLEFGKEAKAANFPALVEQRPETLAQHFGAWNELLGWLAMQRLARPSDRSVERDLDPGVTGRSIADVFARRFIVVVGTGGSNADRSAIARMGKQFQDSWAQTCYVPCRVCTDRDFDAAKDGDSNLVLIGNARTNSVWRNVASRLPIACGIDYLKLGAHEWHEKDLGFEVDLQNPLNSQTQVVLVGGDLLDGVRLGATNLAVNGWFDFAVWRNNQGKAQLVDAGIWTAQ
jgi:hypothetical protein